jgi:hypothetical protein
MVDGGWWVVDGGWWMIGGWVDGWWMGAWMDDDWVKRWMNDWTDKRREGWLNGGMCISQLFTTITKCLSQSIFIKGRSHRSGKTRSNQHCAGACYPRSKPHYITVAVLFISLSLSMCGLSPGRIHGRGEGLRPDDLI